MSESYTEYVTSYSLVDEIDGITTDREGEGQIIRRQRNFRQEMEDLQEQKRGQRGRLSAFAMATVSRPDLFGGYGDDAAAEAPVAPVEDR